MVKTAVQTQLLEISVDSNLVTFPYTLPDDSSLDSRFCTDLNVEAVVPWLEISALKFWQHVDQQAIYLKMGFKRGSLTI